MTNPPVEKMQCKGFCPPAIPLIRERGQHIGAYCAHCRAYIKWLPQTPELVDWVAMRKEAALSPAPTAEEMAAYHDDRRELAPEGI